VVQLTGYIEALDVSYDTGSHSISFTGRDQTADLIDGSINVDGSVFSGGTLPALILHTLAATGNDDIRLQFSRGLKESLDANPFVEGEGASAGVGDSIFNYLESYCRKRQVIMTTNGFGGVKLITSNDSVTRAAKIINKMEDLNGTNNVLKGSLKLNSSKRFHFYICSSSGNASQVNAPRDSAEVVSQDSMASTAGEFEDTFIRPNRAKHFQAEQSSNASDCQARAEWEYNLALGQYLTYMVDVEGHSDANGQAWNLNDLYRVQDDFAGLDEPLLLKSIHWKFDTGTGSTTSLTFVLPIAYKNAGDSPASKKSKGNTSAGKHWDFT
jgi:prophage tail gpP-like protein